MLYPLIKKVFTRRIILRVFIIVILTFVFLLIYFFSLFNVNQQDLPRFHYLTIRKVPFKTKANRFVSYASSDPNVDHIYFEYGRMKTRGSSSEKFPKRSFTVEFKSKSKINGLEKDDDWILNASYIDKSFIRNKLSYDLFIKFNTENIAPKCSFIEVYRNLQYHGLYILTERMDRKRIGIDKGDLSGQIFKEPILFLDAKNPFMGNNPSVQGDLHHQKYPKLNLVNYTDTLEELRRFISYSPDSIFNDLKNGIYQFFDIKNIIDWHILLLLTHNSNGVSTNFYLYKLNGSSKYSVVPWDYDDSFGRNATGKKEITGIINLSNNLLLSRLLQDPIYLKLLKTRYLELVASGIMTAEGINSMVDENYKLISPHISKNESLWGLESEYYFDNYDFEQEIDLIRNWIPIQLDSLNDYFDKLID